MQSKLTLRIDDALINKAKQWSKNHQVSLSQTVASFFRQLPENQENNLQHGHGAWAQSLAGSVPSRLNQSISDKAIRQEHQDYLEEKHQ